MSNVPEFYAAPLIVRAGRFHARLAGGHRKHGDEERGEQADGRGASGSRAPPGGKRPAAGGWRPLGWVGGHGKGLLSCGPGVEVLLGACVAADAGTWVPPWLLVWAGWSAAWDSRSPSGASWQRTYVRDRGSRIGSPTHGPGLGVGSSSPWTASEWGYPPPSRVRARAASRWYCFVFCLACVSSCRWWVGCVNMGFPPSVWGRRTSRR